MKIRLLLLACLTVFICFYASANTGPDNNGQETTTRKNDIVGGVFDSQTGKPVAGVSVTAYLAAKKEKMALTGHNGTYAFDELKAGTYKFVFEKGGYRKVVKEKIIIRPDESFQLNIEIEEQGVFDFMPGPFHFSDFD